MAGSYCGCSANWEALMKIAWSSITASFRSDGMMRKSAFGKPCPMASPPASKVTRFGGCGYSVTTLWQVPTKDGGYETIALSRSQAISRAGATRRWSSPSATVRPVAFSRKEGVPSAEKTSCQGVNGGCFSRSSRTRRADTAAEQPRAGRRQRQRNQAFFHSPSPTPLAASPSALQHSSLQQAHGVQNSETQPAKSAAATSGRQPNTKLRGTSKSCKWKSWADSRFV